MFLREILWEWQLPCYYETLIVQMVNKLLIESFQIFKLVECTSEYVKVLRQSHQVEQICRKNKLLYFVGKEIFEAFVQIDYLSVYHSYPRYLLI
jgi:hypothetical protein